MSYDKLKNEQFKELGYSKEKRVEQVKEISTQSIRAKLDKINSFPIEVIKKHIHPLIFDFQAEYKQQVNCRTNSQCRPHLLNIFVIYDSHIKGITLPSWFAVGRNREFKIYNTTAEYYSNFFAVRDIAKISIKMTVHIHNEPHAPSDYKDNKIKTIAMELMPLPYNLKPRQTNRLRNNGYDPILNKKTIDAFMNFKPTIKAVKDIFSGNDSDFPFSELTNRSYDTTRLQRFMSQTFVHPQYMREGGSFCFGDFFQNTEYKTAKKDMNFVGALRAFLTGYNETNIGDNQINFGAFSSCFSEPEHILNLSRDNEEKIATLISKLSSLTRKEKWSVIPTEQHYFSIKCYCVDCIRFKYALHSGSKYNPRYFVDDSFSVVSETRWNFIKSKKHTKEHKEIISIIDKVTDNITDYHVERSLFDYEDAILPADSELSRFIDRNPQLFYDLKSKTTITANIYINATNDIEKYIPDIGTSKVSEYIPKIVTEKTEEKKVSKIKSTKKVSFYKSTEGRTGLSTRITTARRNREALFEDVTRYDDDDNDDDD